MNSLFEVGEGIISITRNFSTLLIRVPSVNPILEDSTSKLTSTCNEDLLQEFRAAVKLENLKEVDVISLLANCPHMDQDTLNKGGMYNGKTALYLASHEGYHELVQALLEQDNIDVNMGRE